MMMKTGKEPSKRMRDLLVHYEALCDVLGSLEQYTPTAMDATEGRDKEAARAGELILAAHAALDEATDILDKVQRRTGGHDAQQA